MSIPTPKDFPEVPPLGDVEARRIGTLLDKINVLSGELPDDPRACVAGIRELMARYDTDPVPDSAPWTDKRRVSCPPWCVEHYTATDGTHNHSSYPRAVTGESADVDHVDPVMVSVWVELREKDGERPHAVGILEKIVRSDAEFSHCQLRELARHCREVADQVEAIEGAAS